MEKQWKHRERWNLKFPTVVSITTLRENKGLFFSLHNYLFWPPWFSVRQNLLIALYTPRAIRRPRSENTGPVIDRRKTIADRPFVESPCSERLFRRTSIRNRRVRPEGTHPNNRRSENATKSRISEMRTSYWTTAYDRWNRNGILFYRYRRS